MPEPKKEHQDSVG